MYFIDMQPKQGFSKYKKQTLSSSGHMQSVQLFTYKIQYYTNTWKAHINYFVVKDKKKCW